MKKMPANNPQWVEAKPVLIVNEGQQLLVRVYPWYNGAASGKTIWLSDLRIHGMASEAVTDGVQSVAVPQQQTAETIYDLLGRRYTSAHKGLSLMRQADGTIKKVIL